FPDTVIDRYSDLVVLLGIVALFTRITHMRGAVAAMAALGGSLMVSYTKARAESIGVECNVGFMERPERMICLIGGALFGLLEPALWVLAVLANITAVHRILFTRRITTEKLATGARRRRTTSEVLGALVTAAVVLGANVAAAADPLVSAEIEKAWARAVDAYQQGDAAPLVRELASDAALGSPIADYARYLAAEAEAIAADASEPGIALRALRVVADASQRLGRYDVAAKAIEMALKRAPADKRAGLQLEQARVFSRAGDREKDKQKARALKEKALSAFFAVMSSGLEAEGSEAAYLRARLLDDMGRGAEAVNAYRAVA